MSEPEQSDVIGLTLNDIKQAAKKLPHPSEWKTNMMNVIYLCEDGKERRMLFEFNCVDVIAMDEADRVLEDE